MLNYNYNNLLSALSLALDILEKRNMGHARRVAYISLRISQMLNLNMEEQKKVYYSSFLHDIGKSDAYEDFNTDKSWEHSKRGSDIVKNLPNGDSFSDIIMYHHENYDGSGYFNLRGSSIPLASQIIFVSDQFDIKYNTLIKTQSEYSTRSHIKEWIGQQVDKMFNPELVKVLCELMRQEKFWLDYEYFDIKSILKSIEPDDNILIGINDLEKIAEAFAQIIDNKSRFTYNHSKSISELAYKMARTIGYSAEPSQKVKIAGLLHDIGKLAIPNYILDKPDKLTDEEFVLIKSHTYYTKKNTKRSRRHR